MIIRTPIKIRKPILKDYCNCFGQNTVSVDGIPQGIYVKGYEGAKNVLENYLEIVPIYIKDALGIEELEDLLSYKAPLNLLVDNLPYLEEMLPLLSKIPYCGITLDVTSSMDFEKLRSLLHVAKSTKIHIIGLMRYNPALSSRLDLYSVIEQVKNYIHHILLEIPQDISDEIYTELKHSSTWNDKRFQEYYDYEVTSGKWYLRSETVDSFMEFTHKHLKLRKISVECINFVPNKGRIRHNIGESNLIFGMRPFPHARESSVREFSKVEDLQGTSCEQCKKPIFD